MVPNIYCESILDSLYGLEVGERKSENHLRESILDSLYSLDSLDGVTAVL